MSYKDAIVLLDELYYEQAMLIEAKDNSELYEDLICIETQLMALELEIEQIEATILKYN